MDFTGRHLDPRNFKSKDEVLKILKENHEDYQALMQIANYYFELYGNELVWHYPLSGTDYTGVHIIAVREGFLCVPYDAVDIQDHELFELERAYMLDAGTAEALFVEWKNYSESLTGALRNIVCILKETPDGEEAKTT